MAACSSVCVAQCYRVMSSVKECCRVLKCLGLRAEVFWFWCVAVCCRVLQCVLHSVEECCRVWKSAVVCQRV